MSVWSGGVWSAAIGSVVVRVAEDDTEFDPNQVTPGVEGFIMTGLLAAAVIILGFLVVRRLRRSAYRYQIREEIADEVSGAGGAEDGGGGSADSDPGSDSRG